MKIPDLEAADPELIAIRTFISEPEAEIAKSALAAFGIECILSRDNCGGQRVHMNMGEGIRLIVRSEDAERAEDVLTSAE